MTNFINPRETEELLEKGEFSLDLLERIEESAALFGSIRAIETIIEAVGLSDKIGVKFVPPEMVARPTTPFSPTRHNVTGIMGQREEGGSEDDAEHFVFCHSVTDPQVVFNEMVMHVGKVAVSGNTSEPTMNQFLDANTWALKEIAFGTYSKTQEARGGQPAPIFIVTSAFLTYVSGAMSFIRSAPEAGQVEVWLDEAKSLIRQINEASDEENADEAYAKLIGCVDNVMIPSLAKDKLVDDGEGGLEPDSDLLAKLTVLYMAGDGDGAQQVH